MNTLEFLSTLIWQGILVGCLWMFRKQLGTLFERVGKVKVGDTEVAFQSPAESATAPQGDAALVVGLFDEAGFYTKDGVTKVVEGSGLIGSGEKVRGSLLIFKTSQQQTWLVATDRQVFCILDDDVTSASGRLIQWRMSVSEARPVKARRYRKAVGLLDIGSHSDWLYSTHLHPNPRELETDVSRLIGSGA